MCFEIFVLASLYTYSHVMCISRACTEIDKIFWISFIVNAPSGNMQCYSNLLVKCLNRVAIENYNYNHVCLSEGRYKYICFNAPLADEIILMSRFNNALSL